MQLHKPSFFGVNMPTVLLFIAILLVNPLLANVHTSYLWHLEQPIYWPEQSIANPYRYQAVWESQQLKLSGGNLYSDGLNHPLNNLEEIFTNDDRRAVYQYRAKDAVQSLQSYPEGGAQVNYSGCLIENVNSLANASQWGYSNTWASNFRTARNWTTSGGKPRMDIVGFTMHHALSPLIDENCLRKQIQVHKYLYGQTFGNSPIYSKGYWPAECSFSERIIKVLIEEGFEWSIVANSHLARTNSDYPVQFGTSGCNIDPPNKADQVNQAGQNWWNGQIDGRGGTFSAPFSYQAHKAKYVDPNTGNEYKLTVVPMCDLLSYINGYGSMGTSEIDSHIAPYDDPTHPSIVLLAHDGDNAWGGGFSYYSESVPGFAAAANERGYTPTTIQQFLSDHPVPAQDIVHVEDGSWVNAANDWGHPQFINWLWPMYTSTWQFDPNGWTEDARNWAILTAAENYVETAEQIQGTVNIAKIAVPDQTSTSAEKAWHFFLPAFNSGYMYYGTALDMEVKQTIACNKAIQFAEQTISSSPESDNTAPSIFIPQRYPYNPGGTGFGPTYSYQTHQNSSDFTIWTFAYDVSGLQSISLKYRLDEDGINPLSDNANDTYSGGPGVGNWNSTIMTERVFPTGNVTNNPDINFFILPTAIANEYYASITGVSNSLVDYFVEATDSHGNIKRSPIQHVYVGESTPVTSPYVTWTPTNPTVGDTLQIFYSESGTLFNQPELYLHIGYNQFQGIQDIPMTFNEESHQWQGSYMLTSSMRSVDFVFTNLSGQWDNNQGADWHISIPGTTQQFIMDGTLDIGVPVVAATDDLQLYLARREDQVYVAATPATSSTDAFILVSGHKRELVAAPWGKAGQVMSPDLFLSEEGTNGYKVWNSSAGTTGVALGSVLEGTFSLSTELVDADTIYIALAHYQTNDGGTLSSQCPEGNQDNIISSLEFLALPLSQIVNVNEEVQAPIFGVQTFPNPFISKVNLFVQIPKESQSLTLQVFNIKGQLIRQIQYSNRFIPGQYTLEWDGKDSQGKHASRGIYLLRVQSQHAKPITVKSIKL